MQQSLVTYWEGFTTMANRKGNRVCMLSDGEAHDLSMFGIQPDCKLHQHCSPNDAHELTLPVWMQLLGKANPPVADWVGPQQIHMNRHYRWSVVNRSPVPLKGGGFAMLSQTTNQLVPCSV